MIPDPPPVARTAEVSPAFVCALCGLLVPHKEHTDRDWKDTLSFCCMGCRQVCAVLTAVTGALPGDFQKTDLYQACLRAGIIPGRASARSVDEAETQDRNSGEETAAPTLDLSLQVANMWCPACGWIIEEVLRRKRGVLDPAVAFLADTVRLKYLPHVVSPAEIASAVTKLGYRVSLPGDGPASEAPRRDLLVRLGISAILAMNAMMLSWIIYSGLFRDLGATVIAYLSYPLLLMTAPVVFYGGFPILRSAWHGLRLKTVSMDTLIAISTLAAFFYSVAEMLRGSVHLYFDTAAMLVTIVLFGRSIETWARHRVLAGMGLDELGLQKARLEQNGQERWVSADAVRPGDTFIVRPGERVPLDGNIVRGNALLDQSALTGEPKPVSRGKDEEVLAGSALVDGEIAVSASRTAKEGSLRRMVDLVLDALEGRHRGEEVADTFSRFFVPALVAATGLTAVILIFSGFSGREVLLRCLTMLLVSCPCAIGIAVPLVKVAIVGLARKKGILVRNAQALEELLRVDTVVLDKTGTVTEGRFVLHEVFSGESNESEILPVLAAVEKRSDHLIARQIARRAAESGIPVPEAADVKELPGLGITGTVRGREVFIGNRRLLAAMKAPLSPALDLRAASRERDGQTVVFFGWSKTVEGMLAFGDPVRPGAAEFVRWLQGRGIRVLLLSGDGVPTTEAVARSLSIDECSGQMLPPEKAEKVMALVSEGRKVAMMGDGVNDAAALATAHVGVALGTGYAAMREAADLVITAGKLGAVKDTFDIAALSAKAVRRNLLFAFLYNAAAIPVAAAGLLNPLIAVFAMFASSLTVTGNALRLARAKLT